MKKISVKILFVSIMTLICILLNTMNNIVQAIFFDVNEVELYSKEEAIYLIYDNIRIGTEFVVYNMNGVEYPAYCMNRELTGITGDCSYKVEIQSVLENQLVWRAIINGYPYKTYSELGCNSELEAFVATKMAAYNMLYNYDMSKFSPIGEEGKRVLEAFKKISEIARSSQEEYHEPSIILEEQSKWQVSKDNNYQEKIYKINSNVNINSYHISIEDKMEGVVLSDVYDNEKEVFNQKDLFKVKIPIEKLNQNYNLKYHILVSIENKSIVYGKSTIPNKQNYALTGNQIGNIDIYSNDQINKNETKLIIEKVDKENQNKIEKTIFNIWNEKGNLIKENISTNEEGLIQLDNLKPGKYYIQEVQPADGYIIDESMYEVDIKYGEEKKIVVENEKTLKKIVEETIEEKIVEQKEIKLPRTGR